MEDHLKCRWRKTILVCV